MTAAHSFVLFVAFAIGYDFTEGFYILCGKDKQIYFYNNNDELIVRLDRLYGKDYTAINWVDWLPTVMRKPNSLFNSALTDKFSDGLKTFLLRGPSKVRSLYMKALTELTKNMSLEYYSR